MGLVVNVTSKEIIRGKFMKTLMKLQGYIQEAKGDIEVSQSYSAKAVHSRMERIMELMEEDMTALENSIQLPE